MTTRRPVRPSVCVGAVVLAATIADGICGVAAAQGKLDARYTVTLSGVPVGRGAWMIDIQANQFTAAASGATAGLLKMFSSGRGSSASHGTIASGQLMPATYASSIVTDKKYDDVRMVINAGTVKEFAVDPPSSPDPNRVPITEAHRHGVSDPMTASLLKVPGTGDPVSSQACQRTVPIFDGRMRYDLQFVYKRMERVKADSGYQGQAVVCAVYFTPIAGHIPNRAVIKYLSELRDMEIFLVPIAGTRIVVPHRLTIPTPIGFGVMQATQFISGPQPQATPTSVKNE